MKVTMNVEPTLLDKEAFEKLMGEVDTFDIIPIGRAVHEVSFVPLVVFAVRDKSGEMPAYYAAELTLG